LYTKLYTMKYRRLFSSKFTLTFIFLITTALNATNNPGTVPEGIPERMEGLSGADRLAVVKAPTVAEIAWLDTLAQMTDTITRNYIAQFWRIAVAEYENGGYRPSLKMAQAIIETNRGRSVLAERVNAHFGIKTGWNSEIAITTMIAHDDRVDDCFNGYRAAEDSWRDHSEFMKQDRYRKVVAATTLKEACYALGVSGYATSQYKWWKRRGHYYGKPGATILATIRRYNLEMLDRMVGATD
jgi:hypothetical protein